MQSVALAPPLWAATLRSLRRLTRMAATALALAVGLNGVTVPAPGDSLRPAATVRPLAGIDVAHLAVDDPPAGTVAVGPGHTAAITWAPDAGATTVDSAARHPHTVWTAPATGVPPRDLDRDAASARVDAAPVVAPADPGRQSVARRGPPRA
ncbi:hypothetical protein Q2K19_08530 [Micromonospora soli]|uniref:hypothetical protein n=1 Tax=Micromonospora sp. NBRC 110009 TaxID=3061627 RepID=UPI0026727EC4|nr:hypothetical protein [Micromonospora sp. NBRC 110009]WKU00510.1 hypothetical protein Q2K19_08530 [Micromonospora sp. NBRC 110009]